MPSSPVVACIPYYRCPAFIAPAVESILNQTNRDFILIVSNDADEETPPWPALAHITDPRLIRFDLKENHGSYFAIQVALAATSSPYLLIQDADDWSHPERLAKLLAAIEKDKSDLAISDRRIYSENADGSMVFLRTDSSWNFQNKLNDELKFRISHHGLFRKSTLQNMGGYYGGFRISYDMYLTNILLLAGQVSIMHQPLYNYYKRPSSLTVAGATGMQSTYRTQINNQLQALYKKAHAIYLEFVAGKISSQELFGKLAGLHQEQISAPDRAALAMETSRLRDLIY